MVCLPIQSPPNHPCDEHLERSLWHAWCLLLCEEENKEILKDRQNSLVVEYNNRERWIGSIFDVLENPKLVEIISENAVKDSYEYIGKDIIGAILKALDSAYKKKI